jgi:NADH-quinone oxidoreductase subunit G
LAKITVDNQVIECRDGVPVLQAVLESGWDVPHYCYHPGLSIVASCRLCLMEMQLPHPKTGEMGWAPKLFPSCQTPVKDGMVVRFDSEPVRDNQVSCMEYFLLNHPLDCPVCDQAGECYLQDYSYHFGRSESRMVDPKTVNPKKDIGPQTLLYQDRCVMCTRCVRFTQEIAGTGELSVVNRGNRAEIDVFPGIPLANDIQGNVVDICPVGALLDKDFLFKRRVWELKGTPSICDGCSTGCAIRVDHVDETVYRLKPRYNPGVNDWWICDEGRFGWKYIHDHKRIAAPTLMRGEVESKVAWEDVPDILQVRFETAAAEHGGGKIGAMLSPFMSCEEAYLLVKFLRVAAPECVLAMGPVPTEGEEQSFPVGASGDDVKFTIRSEKCPNRRGVERILAKAGGDVVSSEEWIKRAGAGDFEAGWVYGGYPKKWVPKELSEAAETFEFLVVSDMFPSPLTEAATMVLPACAFAERDGSFMNHAGKVQPFERAIQPPEGAKRDGQVLYETAELIGLYSGDRVRELMAEEMPEFGEVKEAPAAPLHQH